MAGEVKLGSLFDGSGGFPLAGVLHGVEPVWASEIEPYPVCVTTARFPGMKHLGDVTKIDGAAIEPVDIITFGSPCQDLSVAGKQAGLHKGERSNLFFEAIRIIKEMREATDGKYPRVAVWENVPGAYSSNKGEDFRAVLEAFAQINDETADVPRPSTGKWNPAGAIVGSGWSVAWRTFDAQYWGVPQRRKRIYLIADFGSERAGEILFEQDRVRGHSAEGGTAREGTADDVEGSAGGSGVNCLTPHEVQTQRIYGVDGVYPAIPANSNGGQNRQAICFQASGDRDNPSISTSEKAYCIPANPMSDRGQAVCFQQNQREEVRLLGEKTGAIAANGGAHQTNYIMFKERAGKPGGGKGILCSDRQFTLSTLTDQSVCYSAGFKAGNSAQAHGIGWQEEISPTLQAGEGGNQKPTVCYAVRTRNTMANGWGVAEKAHTLDTSEGQAVCYQNKVGALCADDYKGINQQYVGQDKVVVQDGSEIARTLAARYDSSPCADRGQNVVCYPINTMVATRWKADDGRTTFGIGDNGDPQFTIGAAHEHAVCYPIDSHQQDSRFKICEDGACPTVPGQMGTGGNNRPMVLYTKQKIGHYCELKVASTQQARQYKSADDLVVSSAKPPRKYIIRRLTPLECCRLQGFPDWWEDGVEGSDSARYKMWGNGLALPNAAHVVGCAVKLIKEAQT